MSCNRTALATLCALALLVAGCGAEPKRVKKAPARPAATTPQRGAPAAAPAEKPETRAASAHRPGAAAGAATAARTAPRTGGATSPKERYREAVELLKSNQLQAAETALLAASKDFPQQAGPHTNLGILYARTNRKAAAAAAFTKAIAANPKNAVAHNWIGVLAREAGHHARAEQAYEQALAADPKYADAQLNLAILYDQYLKRPADALAAYRRYEELTGKKDVRAAVWIAQLQAQLAAASPPPPAAAPKPKAKEPGTRS